MPFIWAQTRNKNIEKINVTNVETHDEGCELNEMFLIIFIRHYNPRMEKKLMTFMFE